MANLEDGHSQVYFLEALPIKSNSKMTNVIGWILYHLYKEKNNLKGSVIVDHLVDNVINNHAPLNSNFLDKDIIVIKAKIDDIEDEWQSMCFDVVVNVLGNGLGQWWFF